MKTYISAITYARRLAKKYSKTKYILLLRDGNYGVVGSIGQRAAIAEVRPDGRVISRLISSLSRGPNESARGN